VWNVSKGIALKCHQLYYYETVKLYDRYKMVQWQNKAMKDISEIQDDILSSDT
jgi:hypothetical protein